jgi:hypothetical protein
MMAELGSRSFATRRFATSSPDPRGRSLQVTIERKRMEIELPHDNVQIKSVVIGLLSQESPFQPPRICGQETIFTKNQSVILDTCEAACITIWFGSWFEN